MLFFTPCITLSRYRYNNKMTRNSKVNYDFFLHLLWSLIDIKKTFFCGKYNNLAICYQFSNPALTPYFNKKVIKNKKYIQNS